MHTHGDRIAASLRTIRTAWPQMLPEGTRPGNNTHTTGTPDPPPPAPITTLSLRRETCELLTDWCRLVIDHARDINGGHMNPHLLHTDAPGMAGWLLIWADWLGAHEAGTHAAAELGRAAQACDAIAKETRVRRFKVGPCIELVHATDGEETMCGGTLVAWIRSEDDLLPPSLRCDNNPTHTYDASEWRRLGERIHHHAETPR